jgi:hypothetical protein
VEFVKSLVYPVVTLLRGGNEKREARRFTKAQKQRPQDYAMYVVDTEIDFEIAPIEFYRPHPPGGLGWILHHYIQGTHIWLRALLCALGTDCEVGGQ